MSLSPVWLAAAIALGVDRLDPEDRAASRSPWIAQAGPSPSAPHPAQDASMVGEPAPIQPDGSPLPPPGPDPRRPPFALPDRLRSAGALELCALEALRVEMEHPELGPVARERAAGCLQLAGRFEEAAALLTGIDPSGAGPALEARIRLRLCLGALVADTPLEAIPCPAVPPGEAGGGDSARAAYVPTLAALLADPEEVDLGPWSAIDRDLTPWVLEDAAWQARWQVRERRSPAVAGALSAIIPGLGRGYIGRWDDAAVTFVLVSVPAGLAVAEWARQDRVTPLVVLPAASAGLLWAGGVYGSVVGARAFNLGIEGELRGEALALIRRRLDL